MSRLHMHLRVARCAVVLLSILASSACVQTMHMGRFPIVTTKPVDLPAATKVPPKRVNGQGCTTLIFQSESSPDNMQRAYEDALSNAGAPYNTLTAVEVAPGGFGLGNSSYCYFLRRWYRLSATAIYVEPPEGAAAAAAAPPLDGKASSGEPAATGAAAKAQDGTTPPGSTTAEKTGPGTAAGAATVGGDEGMSSRGTKTYVGAGLMVGGGVLFAVSVLCLVAGIATAVLGVGVLILAVGVVALVVGVVLLAVGDVLLFLDRAQPMVPPGAPATDAAKPPAGKATPSDGTPAPAAKSPSEPPAKPEASPAAPGPKGKRMTP